MKAKRRRLTLGFHLVMYRWTENGVEQSNHTLWEGLSREDARQKFHQANPHVSVYEDRSHAGQPYGTILHPARGTLAERRARRADACRNVRPEVSAWDTL